METELPGGVTVLHLDCVASLDCVFAHTLPRPADAGRRGPARSTSGPTSSTCNPNKASPPPAPALAGPSGDPKLKASLHG